MVLFIYLLTYLLVISYPGLHSMVREKGTRQLLIMIVNMKFVEWTLVCL